MENNIATLSIYYERQQWITLFRQCIIPLLGSINNDAESDIKVLVRLYGDNEHNCQLIIYGISEQFYDTVSSIEETVKNFLGRYPSHESGNYRFKPGQCLWMPLPNNSVTLRFSPVDAYFSFPRLLFYKQSITNLMVDWIHNDVNIQFTEEEIYTLVLFIQLILLKAADQYKLSFTSSQLFTAIEARLDISNNMKLYQEAILNSTTAYRKNSSQLIEYYNFIDFQEKEDKNLSCHYSIVRSILSGNSKMHLAHDYLMRLLMTSSYELLGITGIKQLYVLNMIKMFCKDYLPGTISKSYIRPTSTYE